MRHSEKNPEHVINESIFNTKLKVQHRAPREVKILFLLLQPLILTLTTNP